MSLRGSPIKAFDLGYPRQPTPQFYTLVNENQRLSQTVITKNAEIQALIESNNSIKKSYEGQAAAYRKTIQNLQSRLSENQFQRQQEFIKIKGKFDQLTNEEMDSIKSSHTNQMEFLFKEIVDLRSQIKTYNSKLDVKQHEIETIRQSYERQITFNTAQINTLNKKIMQMEDKTSKEIKDLNNKRQLEKSRTSGIVSSRKQSSQYMEKQLRNLNEEVLEKTIALENMNRQVLKEKKKYDQLIKSSTKKQEAQKQEYENVLQQKQDTYNKIEKMLKEQILEYKEKQLKLMNENQTLKSQMNSLKRQIQHKNDAIKSKSEQIFDQKSQIQKMREDHINQINNLMKQRKKRSSNMGSSRSLGSSLRESGVLATTPVAHNEDLASKLSGYLPTVKEESPEPKHDISQEFEGSREMGNEEEENQLQRVVFHYDSIIEELKRNYQNELEHHKLKQDKVSKKLEQKENQLEDVLTRFSPLVKIHVGEKTIEQDRKERIQRHWKGDLAVLDCLLRKYKIQAF